MAFNGVKSLGFTSYAFRFTSLACKPKLGEYKILTLKVKSFDNVYKKCL
jgi:hypothetical protein